MPTCENCGYRFKWKQFVKDVFRFKINRKVACPNCSAKQYISNKIMPSLLLHLSFTLFILLFFQINMNALLFVVYLVSWLILFLLVYPFTIKLSNENPSIFH